MNIRIPRRRQLDVPSLLVALFATAASFVMVLTAIGPELFTLRPLSRPAPPMAEHVEFIERLPEAPLQRASAGVPSRARVRARPNSVEGSASAPASEPAVVKRSAVAPAVAPAVTSSANSAPAIPVPYAGRGRPTALLVPKPFDPFAPPPPLTAYQRDSLLNLMRLAVPTTAANRVATREEQDSLWRSKSQPGTIPGRTAGEQGVFILPGPWSGRYDPRIVDTGGKGVTFLSPGPSRAERRRDSVANAQYLSLLTRLQARVRAMQDSLRRGDSIARVAIP